MRKTILAPCLLVFVLAFAGRPLFAQPATSAAPEAVFVNGKVVTVDADFNVREAFAVRGGRIVGVGTAREMRALAREGVTTVRDLGGRMVLPGLIDSHVHAPAAAMFEFDHEIPDMETIRDVLDYITARTKVVPEGEWISLQQVFITRLREARFPTLAELDAVAPKHPVNFRTGPDNMLNTLALRKCGFDRSWVVKDGGPGLDAALSERLFQPFAAGDARSGSGLGLAICHEIVVSLGGQIGLDNHEAGGRVAGLTATVRLALAEDNPGP